MSEDQNNLFQRGPSAKGPVIEAKYEVIDPPTLKADSGTSNNGGVLKQGGVLSRKGFFDRARRHPAISAGVLGFGTALLTGSLGGGLFWGPVQGALAFGVPATYVAILNRQIKHITAAYGVPFPAMRAGFNEARQTFQANRRSLGVSAASKASIFAAWNTAKETSAEKRRASAEKKVRDQEELARTAYVATDTIEQRTVKTARKEFLDHEKKSRQITRRNAHKRLFASVIVVGGMIWALPAATKALVENVGLKAPLLVNVNKIYNPSSHIEAFNTPHSFKHGESECFQKENIYRTPNLDYEKLNEKDRTPVGQTIPGEKYNVTYNDSSKGFDQITIEQPGKRPLKLYVRDRAFTHEK